MGPLIPVALSLLPSLAKWIGGDGAGEVATRAADVVRTVTGADNPADAALAVSDPAKAAELRVALAKIEREAEAAERAAFLADLASARQQTVALAQAGSGIAWAPAIISTVIVVGFFVCTLVMLFVERTWDERTAGLLNTLYGALILGFGQVSNYWLGSSSGSKRSGDAVREIATARPAAAPVVISTSGPVTTDSLNDASLAAARGGRQ
ncbi:hypothetical protein HMPREF9946_03163 [Acetobacteraceae bacterium AT-5844]|nr:hypothetical protein HMPREF9946_03163 [Acetobacteraceae bacterium AT-5844]